MGIAFKKGSVHKCSWITLICIDNYIFDRIFGITCTFPFSAGRKACTSPSSDVGFFNLFENFNTGHLSESFAKSGITVESQIIINISGINFDIITQDCSLLAFIECDIRLFNCFFTCGRVFKKQTVNHLVLFYGLGNNLLYILCLHLDIADFFRINNNNWALFTKSRASGSLCVYFCC